MPARADRAACRAGSAAPRSIAHRACVPRASCLISSSGMMRPCVDVDQEASCRAAGGLSGDILRLDRKHADLGGHDEEVVLGDQIARRAEAVAVQRGADDASVGEGDGGGAVPGFHQRGVVLVEGALVRVHGRVGVPGFRDEHGHDVGQGAAGEREQLAPRCRVARSRCRWAGWPASASSCRRPRRVTRGSERACIHAELPRTVLISPLWQT